MRVKRLCQLPCSLVCYLCWLNALSLTQINLYGMEISEEYYYFALFPCRLLEGYFKRQLIRLWLGRQSERTTPVPACL